jgi:tetratricopeptide (TPR) repeat protein
MERSITLIKLGEVLLYSRRAEEAQLFAEEALALRHRLFGPSDARVADALANLAVIESRIDRPDDAERHAQEALRIAGRAGNARTTLGAYTALVEALNMSSRHDEAAEVARRQLVFTREAFGSESVLYTSAIHKLALSLSLADRPDEALPLWDEDIQRQREEYGPTSPVVTSLLVLAGRTARDGRFIDRAEHYFTQAVEQSQALPASSRTRAEAALRLGWLYLDQGRARGALEPLRAAAEAREALSRPALLHVHGATSDGDRAVALLGEALVATGDTTEGVRLLAEAAPALADSLGADHRDAQRAQAVLNRSRGE